MPRALWLALLAGALGAQPLTKGADLARAVLSTELDPDQCFLVRDLAFAREDIKLYFNDGYLIFSKPVLGERTTAVFTSFGEDPADGELLLLPPHRDERQSLAKFTHTPNLDEHFDTAQLTFTDGTAQALLDEIASGGRGRRAPQAGAALAALWKPAVAAMNESLAQRIVADLLSPVRPGGGFLFAALQNQRLGNFDVIFDPLGDDQIMTGQLSQQGGAFGYDVWTSFPSRTLRLNPASALRPAYRVSSYRITAALDASLRLTATTRAHLVVGDGAARVLTFGISRAERVTAARLDGKPVEIVFQESTRSRALRADENDLFLLVSPEILAPGSTHDVELEHEGDVIADRGSGVYSVGARSNWYPRMALEFAEYELEFRYPKDLTLVTAGEVLDDRTEGEIRITRRKTPGPIRVAGFNLGSFARISRTTDGITVDVYGNRGLDPALAPRPRATLVPQAVRPLYRGAPTTGTTTILQTAPSPDPLGRMEAVAADVSASLQFFTQSFGPPALRTLTVSPMPGTIGQGFPGLIYLSTLAYLEEAQRPEDARDSRQRTFYSDLMVAHEVAHQWWGNAVAPDTYQDEWIMEGLAHYSALLWLEKKRGTAVMLNELDLLRADLLTNVDSGTRESFGPLTWGYRLEAAHTPDTWRAITYGKGAWVFHMLRRRMGDARFLAMLRQMRQRFGLRRTTTQDVRNLVREFAAPVASAEMIDNFFDAWVRSTGIPKVRVRYEASGRAPNVQVSGTVTYEDSRQRGVFEDFAAELPLEIELPNGTKRIEWVRSGDHPEAFRFTLPQAPTRVEIPNGYTLATSR